MKRTAAVCALAGCLILFAGGAVLTSAGRMFGDCLTKDMRGLARVVGPQEKMAEYQQKEYFELNENRADLRWFDCGNLSAEERKLLDSCAPNITFNEETVFLPDIKERLQPAVLLEQGKNPGLSVRSLHEEGITGKGVGIAVIDQVLYTGHPEYASQLQLYEEMHVLPGQEGSMHGGALASFTVGKSCGVAPEADLYYWAFDNMKDPKGGSGQDNIDLEGYADVIDRVLEVNRSLPAEGKIRVIAIARGYHFTGDEKADRGVRKLLEAVGRAEKEGIFVVTTSTELNYDFFQKYDTQAPFAGLGKRDPAADPDSPETYTLGGWQWENPAFCQNSLLVPMDCRTAADMSGDTYVYYAEGGWSWTAPYVAGIYALCVQVNPDITPERFYDAARQTAFRITCAQEKGGQEYGFFMINPEALLSFLEETGGK